jgi:RNA polymerase sigma factor (sigma-70 family)
MSAAPVSIPVSSPGQDPGRIHYPSPPPAVPEAEALLSHYRSGIYAFIRRKGFNPEEADDLTQETLIRAYLHLDGFRGVSMGGWLYRIAANVAVDYLRKQRLTTVPLESLCAVPAGEDDPVVKMARDESGVQLQRIIAELPECHQRILRLRYYEDRSLAEIAGEMNCTPLAAKLRVFRAVSALRKRCRSNPLPGGEMLAG